MELDPKRALHDVGQCKSDEQIAIDAVSQNVRVDKVASAPESCIMSEQRRHVVECRRRGGNDATKTVKNKICVCVLGCGDAWEWQGSDYPSPHTCQHAESPLPDNRTWRIVPLSTSGASNNQATVLACCSVAVTEAKSLMATL